MGCPKGLAHIQGYIGHQLNPPVGKMLNILGSFEHQGTQGKRDIGGKELVSGSIEKNLSWKQGQKVDDFKYEIKRCAHFFMNVPKEANYFVQDLKHHHPGAIKTKHRSNIILPQPNQWLTPI
jgi:hypothetical protein